MSVHYKFKSSLDYDTVTFDGLHISVGDLKKAILQQKKIGKGFDFDLQITNAQTKEVYADDEALIPKNASVIVSRVPNSSSTKRSWERNDGLSLLPTVAVCKMMLFLLPLNYLTKARRYSDERRYAWQDPLSITSPNLFFSSEIGRFKTDTSVLRFLSKRSEAVFIS